ncbi:hypothetical protein GCM10011581_15240 [Saccharopolyspora subtropica]|uniref:WXG100 family type VII secretion target n=1 Tax=Saccharopolyspora thermophila TaxID=89367 RepID=A0A917JNJ3_9PSEU|nr:WXG100 family type VII secretion target [Saccharopolyspora subtropica]GGI79042.1 hypothetical protein GCM10011581_15240 [Saccharopolyspora subtropica]
MARSDSEVAEHLDYLTRIADSLDVSDVVPEVFADLVGHQDMLREAAAVWRRGAERVEKAAGDVQGKLGGIDSAWQGADADAFLDHMQQVGLAGNDLVDTMRVLGDALEETAEAIRLQLEDLGDLLADTADSVSAALLAPAEGANRARRHLLDLAEPAADLAESIADTYRAFARLCDDLGAGRDVGDTRFDRRMPDKPWDFTPPAPAPAPAPPASAEAASAGAGAASGGGGTAGGGGGAAGVGGAGAAGVGGTAPQPELSPGGTTRAVEPSTMPPAAAAGGAAAAGAAAAGAGAGGMYGGMMPMGMMGGMGQQGGEQERKNSSRLKSRPEELFGTPPDAAPAVLGDPPRKQAGNKPAATKPAGTGRLNLPSTPEPAGPRRSIDDALHPKPAAASGATTRRLTTSTSSEAPRRRLRTGTASVGDAPPPKPKTGTASVGDAPPPKPRKQD